MHGTTRFLLAFVAVFYMVLAVGAQHTLPTFQELFEGFHTELNIATRTLLTVWPVLWGVPGLAGLGVLASYQWPGTDRFNRNVQIGAGILLGLGVVLIPLTIVLLYGPIFAVGEQ